MFRSCIVLILFAGSALAQSRVDLLQRVAHRYESADSFEVKGTASAHLPGTSWKVSYSFDAQGMQPAFFLWTCTRPQCKISNPWEASPTQELILMRLILFPTSRFRWMHLVPINVLLSACSMQRRSERKR